MGKLRKLRTRFISSIGAVKRSVLRRQSQSSSTVSNPTSTLTRLVSLDSAVSASTGTRGSKAHKRKMQVRLQDKEQKQQQLQLHWNEARRIYSEPVHVTQSTGGGDGENSCSTGTTVASAVNQEQLVTCRSAQVGSQMSDEEDYDDVFLQSWEEADHRCTEEDFLMGAENSLSDVSSGYSTLSNDNLHSPTLYLPPPLADGAYAELEEQREGDVSGWDDWRITESEVSLGTVISSTEKETVYNGYWHGNVQVRSRRVREVEDLICFLDEVTTLSCIRHENVQLFMGACLSMQEGSLAIVMSEIKGDSLHTRLHSLGHAFTNSSKVKILRQVAEGMEYLHGRGIPHGLLSSQSISVHYRVCISLAPQYSRANARQLEPHKIPYLPPECVRKLCASQCRSRDTSCDHSRCGSCDMSCDRPPAIDCGRRIHSCREDGGGSAWRCGLLRSPTERRVCKVQLKGRPTLPADVFAFGTIVYELMLLEYPYKTLPLETQIWRIGRGDLQDLALIPKGRLRSIICCCWAENPQHRPSFKELLAGIEQDAIAPSASMSPLRPCHSLPCVSAPPSPLVM